MASTRLAKSPLPLPAAVTAVLEGSKVTIKGPKGSIDLNLHPAVTWSLNDNVIQLEPAGNPEVDSEQKVVALTGTMRALLANMVLGVTKGFEKKLTLVGVGYRAQVQGNILNLTLGFSHPVQFTIPEGITIEAPTLTDLVVKGIDKHMVGQVAANIRAYRPPEPYKGKGVRYADEIIVLKEAKK
ncbi:MAG: 50S ribosomal protein L6 [Gammaproteobacteria bacterium]